MDTKCIAVKVAKPLWKAITIAAMESDSTIQDLVVPVLEREFSEERADLKRHADGLRKKLDVALKVSPEPVSTPNQVAVERSAEPPKSVSEFTCKACGKPTKGEFLCPKCKKA